MCAATGLALHLLRPDRGQFDTLALAAAALVFGAPYGALLGATVGYGRVMVAARGGPSWAWRRVLIVAGAGFGSMLPIIWWLSTVLDDSLSVRPWQFLSAWLLPLAAVVTAGRMSRVRWPRGGGSATAT